MDQSWQEELDKLKQEDPRFAEVSLSDIFRRGRPSAGYIGGLDRLSGSADRIIGQRVRDKSDADGYSYIRPYDKALEDFQLQTNAVSRRLLAIEAKRSGGIPDAPFRKDWALALFKRVLRDAVEAEPFQLRQGFFEGLGARDPEQVVGRHGE